MDYKSKDAARQAVWDRLKTERLAAFPFPPHGRIPNYKGASDAARRLFEIDIFVNAKQLKINPDSAQRPVRAEALKRGITIYVPTPRLAAGFMKFDPAKIDPADIGHAVTMSRCAPYAEIVELEDLPQMDAIVCGSVAVTRSGYRCGKGEGYSDIEFAVLSELGHKPVPVATTIHEVQLVGGMPQTATDLRLSYVVTADEIVETGSGPAKSSGIDWAQITAKDLEEMPVLADLKRFLGQSA